MLASAMHKTPSGLTGLVNEIVTVVGGLHCALRLHLMSPRLDLMHRSARGGWGSGILFDVVLARHLCSPIRASRMGSRRCCPSILKEAGPPLILVGLRSAGPILQIQELASRVPLNVLCSITAFDHEPARNHGLRECWRRHDRRVPGAYPIVTSTCVTNTSSPGRSSISPGEAHSKNNSRASRRFSRED